MDQFNQFAAVYAGFNREHYYSHMRPYGPSLLDLPVELLIKVLLQLEWRSVVRCKEVCRVLRNLIDKSIALRYHVELGADGLVDSPFSNLPISERLFALLRRRKAWRELEWEKRLIVPSDGECTAYELVGGIFAKVMSSDDLSPEIFNPGLGNGLQSFQQGRQVSKKMSLISLPSTRGKEGATELERDDVGIDCRDFAIDPAQDLMALVEAPYADPYDDTYPHCNVSIHLRTISTNAKHPQARVPIVSHTLPFAFDGAIVQLCGDVLALFMLVRSIPRILIWQWTTGVLLVNETSLPGFRFADDFSLISNRAFMVTSHFPVGSVKIYPFEVPPDIRSSSLASSFPVAGSARTNPSYPRRHISLAFPALAPNNVYTEITSHTAPFTAGHRADKPFYTSEDVRVHVMSIATEPRRTVGNESMDIASRLGFDAGGPTRGKAGNYTVIVNNRVLLKYAEMARRAVKDNVIEVPWEEWGPRNTRWLNERHNYVWLSPFIYPSTGIRRFVHGSRFVRAKVAPWPAPRSQCRLQVLDFNVHTKRQDVMFEDVLEDPGVMTGLRSVRRVVDGLTEIHEPAIFRSAVLSWLPYSEVTSCEEFPYTGFMIDDERIVGLSASAFSHSDMKHIEVFTF